MLSKCLIKGKMPFIRRCSYHFHDINPIFYQTYVSQNRLSTYHFNQKSNSVAFHFVDKLCQTNRFKLILYKPFIHWQRQRQQAQQQQITMTITDTLNWMISDKMMPFHATHTISPKMQIHKNESNRSMSTVL